MYSIFFRIEFLRINSFVSNNLSNVQKLILRSNNLVTFDSTTNNLTNLNELDLSFNKILAFDNHVDLNNL